MNSKPLRVRGQEIPTLGEALVLAKELDLGLVVEMKEEGLEELVAEALSGSNCIVTSYYHSSLYEIKDISDLRTGIIIASLPIKPVQLALWARADAIFPKRINPRLFKEAHQKGLSGLPLDRQYKRFGELASQVGCGRPGDRRSVFDQRVSESARAGHG